MQQKQKRFFNEHNNMAFHYLTTHNKPTMSTKTLLGLGPAFCVRPKEAQWSDTSRMIDIFKIDVRLKDYLMSNSFTNDDKTPRLHRKNKNGNHQGP